MRPLRRAALCLLVSLLCLNFLIGQTVFRLPRVSEDTPTGKRYAPYSTYLTGTEGFARTTFDSYGYNNDPSAASAARKFLVLGDSHAEALQVPRRENFCSAAQRLLGKGAPVIYNAGVSGQSVAEYLHNAAGLVQTFHPLATVIEVTYTDFTADATSGANACTIVKKDGGYAVLTRSGTSPLLELRQSLVPLCPLTAQGYLKLKNALSSPFGTGRRPFLPAGSAAAAAPEAPDSSLIDWAVAALSQHYAPHLALLWLPYTPHPAGDGLCRRDPQEEAVKTLVSAACARHGVAFLDMQADFDALLQKQGVFPRGFSNTAPGVGHLNAHGHEITGERLAAWLRPLAAG